MAFSLGPRASSAGYRLAAFDHIGSTNAEAVAGDRLAVVVGIGTNVVAAPEGTQTPATSLAALGVHIGAEELFATLSDAWAEFRGIWNNGHGFDEIRRLWLARAAGLGEPV